MLKILHHATIPDELLRDRITEDAQSTLLVKEVEELATHGVTGLGEILRWLCLCAHAGRQQA